MSDQKRAQARTSRHTPPERLAQLHTLQRRLPALLKLGSDQAIVRVAGRVAPLSERGFIARLLEFELHDALLFALNFHMSALGLQCRFNGHWLDSSHQFCGDRLIGTATPEAQTPLRRQLQIGAVTPINRLTRRAAPIGDHQATPTVCAAKHSGQQGPATAAGLCTAHFTVGVDRKLLLIAFNAKRDKLQIDSLFEKCPFLIFGLDLRLWPVA